MPLRIFVFRVPGERASADPNSRPAVPGTVLINPEIEPISEEIGAQLGRLPVDPRSARRRAARVAHPLSWRSIVTATSSKAKPPRFHARVIQHEYDHLDGILYPMRVKDFRYFGFNSELDRAAGRARQQAAQGDAGAMMNRPNACRTGRGD